MFGKLSKNISIKNILIVSLSNIGDVVLTAPVIDVVLRDFPQAKISVIVGPKAQSLFEGHPRISVIVFEKHQGLAAFMKWFLRLRAQCIDVIIDLRQSGLAFFLPSRFHTPLWPTAVEGHMRLKHLKRLETVYPGFAQDPLRSAIIPKEVHELSGVNDYIVIAPGAADKAKRLDLLKFAQLSKVLVSGGKQIVFVGDGGEDKKMIEKIMKDLHGNILTLAGDTDLRQLAYVLKNARLVTANDSGTMHMASYFNVPVVALWGPTDVDKYGPWSSKKQIVYKGKDMSMINVKDIEDAIAQLR